MATARGRLTARLGRLVDAPPPLDDAERFAGHLATEFSAVFLFLCDPSLDATNWRAEQAIRPAVVIRKVCGGNTAPGGMRPSGTAVALGAGPDAGDLALTLVDWRKSDLVAVNGFVSHVFKLAGTSRVGSAPVRRW